MSKHKQLKYVAYSIVGFSLAVLIDKPELIESTIMDFLPDAALLLLALSTPSATRKSPESDGDKASETRHESKHK